MNFHITVEGGKSVRLPVAGKYCDRDIVVTAVREPMQHTVTLSNGHAYSQYCYISYDGNVYHTAGDTFTVPNGAVINCYAYSGSSNFLYVDGEIVNNGTPVNYEYTVTSDIKISFDVQLNSGSKIYITKTDGKITEEIIGDYLVDVDFSEGDQTIAAPDGYLVKSAILQKPESLIPENIAEGVSLFGITGSHEGESHTVVEEMEIEPDFEGGDQILSVPEGYAVVSAIIKKPETLTPSNVREGVNVAGVVGTMKDNPAYTLLEGVEVEPDFSTGDYAINTAEGEAIKSASVKKPETLLPENILKDVNIAGVTGTAEASINNQGIDEFLSGTLTDLYSEVESVVGYACYYRDNLLSADFPVATSIGEYGFFQCRSLATANFPAVTSIDRYALYDCKSLTTANFPAVTSIGNRVFYNCNQLTTVDFPVALSIAEWVFYSCKNLTALVLRATSVASLANVNAFTNSGIASGTCYIYVPAALVDSYKAATNWSTYAAQFRALEDYTVDGTTTGALDETKI